MTTWHTVNSHRDLRVWFGILILLYIAKICFSIQSDKNNLFVIWSPQDSTRWFALKKAECCLEKGLYLATSQTSGIQQAGRPQRFVKEVTLRNFSTILSRRGSTSSNLRLGCRDLWTQESAWRRDFSKKPISHQWQNLELAIISNYGGINYIKWPHIHSWHISPEINQLLFEVPSAVSIDSK